MRFSLCAKLHVWGVKTNPEDYPGKWFFFYFNNKDNFENYVNIEPLACDHFLTGNSERELPSVGCSFIIFSYGLKFFQFLL